MKDQRAKIISRVKKLLAMANDVGSPEEAVIAARRARSMMDKYDISQYEIEQFRDKSKFGEVRNDKVYKYTPKWMALLAVDVAHWNDAQCRTEHDYSDWTYGQAPKKVIKFQGLEADAIMAMVMFEYLRDTIIRLSKEQGYGSDAKKLTSFKMGAACEVIERIRELVAARKAEMARGTGTSLMVVKSQLVEKEFGVQKFRQVSPVVSDSEAALAGALEGAKINLHSQIGTEPQKVIS